MNRTETSKLFDYVICNGELLPAGHAKVSIFNEAFFSSFGVYETVKIDGGKPFYLEEHLRRLQQSAQMIELDLGVDAAPLSDWFAMLHQIDPEASWRLKIIAVGSIEPGSASVIAMQSTPLPTYPLNYYKKGASAILYKGQRMMPACKSLNTLLNYLARHKAHQAGALEGLLHHQGNLIEGARSNLFAVRQGELYTPPAAEVLSGITRDVILQVMQDTGSPVTEAPLPADLSLYEEIFISSTSMHVMPITTIDGCPVGSGQVGPLTKTVMARFKTYYRQFMESAQRVV